LTVEWRDRHRSLATVDAFLGDDLGAVTIDWVAVTGGILPLGITVVYALFNNGVAGLATSMNSVLAAAGADVSTGNPPGPGTFVAQAVAPPAPRHRREDDDH